MSDPLVVDTFLEVYKDIAPTASIAVADPPLRAITDAAIVSPPATPLTGLDNIAGSTEEMLTLFSLARGLTPSTSLQDTGDVIAKHSRRLVPSSLCVFYVYDSDADELVAAHAVGDHAGVISGLRIGIGQRLSGWVAANKFTIRNSDPLLDFGESARTITPRLRSCLTLPSWTINN